MARRARRIGVGAIAAAVAMGGIVLTAPAPAPASVVTPTVVSHATTKVHALATPGLKKIQSLTLAAGTWSIFAKATAVDPSGTDFFRCQLVATNPLRALDGSTTQLDASVARDVVTNVAVFKTTTSATIRQDCGHDGDAGDAGSIDAGASLVAFLVAPTRIRLTRTTAQTPLPKATKVGVANLSLPKGAWILAEKVPEVVLNASESYVDCAFGSLGLDRQLGTQSGFHGVTPAVKVGTVTLASTTTLTLSCEAGADGVYLDPHVVLWAWKAKDLASTASPGADMCPLTLSASASNDALVLDQVGCDIAVGSYPSEIVGVHLQPGTWVAIGAYDTIWPRTANVARCELLNASRQTLVDTASTSLPTADILGTEITNVAAITAARQLDVEARCGIDNAGSAARAGESGWAFIKP